MIDLGKNIRQLRHEKGWNQGEVAKQLDISIPAYSKIETGVTDINLSRLEQIAGLFELSVIQLLSFGAKPNNSQTELLLTLKNKFFDRGQELADLQNKVIELHEELRSIKSLA